LFLSRGISISLSKRNATICDHIWDGDLISTITKHTLEGHQLLGPIVTKLYIANEIHNMRKY
jgi:hypothetical protein